MTPAQLRAVADRLRRRYPPPDPAMTPGRYLSCGAMHEIAYALDEQAAEEERA